MFTNKQLTCIPKCRFFATSRGGVRRVPFFNEINFDIITRNTFLRHFLELIFLSTQLGVFCRGAIKLWIMVFEWGCSCGQQFGSASYLPIEVIACGLGYFLVDFSEPERSSTGKVFGCFNNWLVGIFAIETWEVVIRGSEVTAWLVSLETISLWIHRVLRQVSLLQNECRFELSGWNFPPGDLFVLDGKTLVIGNNSGVLPRDDFVRVTLQIWLLGGFSHGEYFGVRHFLFTLIKM
jgi:hypothetical protein